MDPKALAEIDRQIAQLKKELNVLFGKRIAILHDEIKRSEAEAHALSGGTIPPSSTAARVKKAKSAKPLPAGETLPIPEEVAPAPDESKPLASPGTSEPQEENAPPARRRTTSTQGDTPALEALKEAGLFGLTQGELSAKTGLGAQAVAKMLKSLPGITKKGAGKEARYYLKG